MKKIKRMIGIAFFVAMLSACGAPVQQQKGIPYTIYYVNNEETGITAREYYTQTQNQSDLIEEFLQCLGAASEKLQYKSPLAGAFSLLEYSFTEEQLTLCFDEKYREQSVTTEVLVRAAIVRTLTQIDGIKYISFQIRNEPLADSSGELVGRMTAETFIDNAGNEINTYEKAKLTLFFANESGDKLRAVNRTVVYNSNIPMERLVVEQLIAGPAGDDAAYPVFNPETKMISVNVKDGICYVNLGTSFLTQIYNVTSQVTVYSLTNSLVELANVNKVQISINGDTNINYKENMSFSTIFERNLEIVE